MSLDLLELEGRCEHGPFLELESRRGVGPLLEQEEGRLPEVS